MRDSHPFIPINIIQHWEIYGKPATNTNWTTVVQTHQYNDSSAGPPKAEDVSHRYIRQPIIYMQNKTKRIQTYINKYLTKEGFFNLIY